MADLDLEALTQSKFHGGDAESIKQEMIDDLRHLFGDDWSNFYASSFGMILVQLFARAAYRVSFKIDRNATDAFAKLARVRRNACYLSQQLGYSPRGASSAGVTVTVVPTTAQSFVVLIPSGFRFKSKSGLYFYTDQDYSFAALSTTVQSIALLEGDLKTVAFTATGQANQEFELGGISPDDGSYLKDGSVTVTVAGVAWSVVNVLDYTVGGANQCEVWYATEPPRVVFGDGLSANIPPAGASVEISYVISAGLAGNVVAGQIIAVDKPLVVAGTTVALTVTQPLAAEGGLGLETVGAMLATAIGVYNSRSVAVTATDFEALALAFSSARYGSVSAAAAISPRGGGLDMVVSALLADVRTALGDPATDIQAFTTLILARTASILTETTRLYTSLDDISTANVTGINTMVTAVANLVAATTSIVKATASNNAALTFVATIAAGGSDTLTAPTRATLNGLINSGIGFASAADGSISSARTNLGDIKEAQNDVADEVSNATSARSAMATYTANISSYAESIVTITDDMLDAIEPPLQAVYDYVDRITASDSKANVIQVPILGRDADGFYARPSVGLRQALKDHFDGIKEPHVVVEVVDGSASLVTPVLTINGTYEKGAVSSKVQASATALLGAFFKDLKFGASCYLDDVYGVLEPTTGKHKFTVTITSPPEYIDGNGNLVIPSTKVLGRPTLTFNLTEKA